MDGVCELVPKWLTWFEYVGSAINTDRPNYWNSAREFSSSGHVTCHFVVD